MDHKSLIGRRNQIIAAQLKKEAFAPRSKDYAHVNISYQNKKKFGSTSCKHERLSYTQFGQYGNFLWLRLEN